VIEFDTELKQCVGWCMGIPGAHSQGSTMEELYANIREALELVIEVQGMGA
jgi:predicted RNase H-like HicB family nuclease